jgi:ABC-type bacteriocin/lantibiotic exporter with double-glycine peptidase domain
VIDMPKGTQSYQYDCGTKVLHLIMAYYGVEVPYHRLLRKAKEHKKYGLPEDKLIKMAKRRKFNVIAHDGFTLDEIKKQVNKNRPVIVLLQAWVDKGVDYKKTNDFSHYSIVVGFEKKRVILNDPLSFKKVWLTEKEFLDRWHTEDNSNYAMVIYKRRAPNNEMEHMF